MAGRTKGNCLIIELLLSAAVTGSLANCPDDTPLVPCEVASRPAGENAPAIDVDAADPLSPGPIASSSTPGEPQRTDAPSNQKFALDNGKAEEPPQDTTEPSDEIVVNGRMPSSADPVEAINVKSFAAVQAVDKAVIGPVAHTYMSVVPKPVQSGLHNFLNNLDEPVVFLNFLLQLKPGKAAETVGRFAINSTIGIGGVIDVAKKRPFKLPRRPNGFADTMGYYGVGPGPYLFLPVVGSTTVRDLAARPFDLLVLPTAVGGLFSKPAFSVAKSNLSAVDERVSIDGRLHELRDNSSDPYAAIRNEYLARRQAEIDALRGKPAPIEASVNRETAQPSAESGAMVPGMNTSNVQDEPSGTISSLAPIEPATISPDLGAL